MFDVLIHTHSGMWGVMVILFILSIILFRQSIWRMLLRLAYLVMIVTGIWMLILQHFPGAFVLKGILALILVGMMEMALARRRKEQPSVLLWVLLAVDLIVILLLGYKII
ncbi:DUF1516 family protein [Terrilactibacillus sp. S3-3]|nr:DUF1516 family protein [Terrilactibacillus sp. S3-3]